MLQTAILDTLINLAPEQDTLETTFNQSSAHTITVPYDVIHMTINDAAKMFDFYQTVTSALACNEKNYVAPRTQSDFFQHFESGHKAVAFVSGDKILGQALITHPSLGNVPQSCHEMLLNKPLQSVSVIQSLCTHPESRGLGVGRKLISAWQTVAAAENRTELMAKTDKMNARSGQLFGKHGFTVIHEGVDQATQREKLYHHKSIL